ncbi:unnamed protein product [Ceratitis capitata]|uniref:(Mediterranean fruit fly) hypothetical protein n=1 Tax=Ceratitis capitata TaxID=7213 RepID=A0A811UAH7_CERCA|nr:unnamed protein product [Ceratitis capitata]
MAFLPTYLQEAVMLIRLTNCLLSSGYFRSGNNRSQYKNSSQRTQEKNQNGVKLAKIPISDLVTENH